MKFPMKSRGDPALLQRVSRHAVLSRYSGVVAPPNAADRKQAVALAIATVNWAKAEIARVQKRKKAEKK